MGTLSEVRIVRTQDQVTFTGLAWATEDGFFEAFWREEGIRQNGRFNSEGNQKWPKKTHKMIWPD